MGKRSEDSDTFTNSKQFPLLNACDIKACYICNIVFYLLIYFFQFSLLTFQVLTFEIKFHSSNIFVPVQPVRLFNSTFYPETMRLLSKVQQGTLFVFIKAEHNGFSSTSSYDVSGYHH